MIRINAKINSLISLLSIFSAKRPDIGYRYGMNFTAALILSIFSNEGDAFVMFCHLMENVYPQNFFSPENRYIARNTEYRAFTL